MVILFDCSHCKAALKADDEMAGKTATCPKCGNEITVPEKKDEEQTQQE